MPTPYPKNSYIINEDGERRKVLEEHGDLRFVSMEQRVEPETWETTAAVKPLHILELKRDGWVVEGVEKKEETKPLKEEDIQELYSKARGIIAEAKDEWPKAWDNYWFFDRDGNVERDFWHNHLIDMQRKTNGFGIYRTREEAIAALRIYQEAWRKAGMMK